MEPKKNPNADPRRNSFLYFSMGLMTIVLLSYAAIELRSYEREIIGGQSNVDNSFLDEDVPMTQQLNVPPPPPPPPPPAPEIIKVVEDKVEIQETIIESTETNQKEEVVKAEKVVVQEAEIDIDVPFAIIEDVPVYPGCEKVAKDKRRECFQNEIQKFIQKNQRYPEAAMDNNIQGRVNVSFAIEKDGTITVVGVRGPDKSLEKEAERVISKLPKMTPGKQRGKPVRMTMGLPIIFRLQ